MRLKIQIEIFGLDVGKEIENDEMLKNKVYEIVDLFFKEKSNKETSKSEENVEQDQDSEDFDSDDSG